MKIIEGHLVKWRIKPDVYLVLDVGNVKQPYISDENNGIGIRFSLTELGDLQESIEEFLSMTVTEIAKLRESLEENENESL